MYKLHYPIIILFWLNALLFAIGDGRAVASDHDVGGEAAKSVVLPLHDMTTRLLSGQEEIFVNEIKLIGNTIFSLSELAPLITPYTGRAVRLEELHELVEILTRYYIDFGYSNSGAVLPDQEVQGGVINIVVKEGELTSLELQGNSRISDYYITKPIDLGIGRGISPLNIYALQQSLELLKQDPRIANIHADLGPGVLPGESVLRVQVLEAIPYNISLHFDNHTSPNIGSYRGEVALEHLNLTGFGDTIKVSYGLTEGVDEWAIRYSVPITARRTYLSAGIERSKSLVVADHFLRLDIRNETRSYDVAIRHPFYRTPGQEFVVELKLERHDSVSYLLGERFTFSNGGENGESIVTVLRGSGEFVSRTLQQVIAVRSTFSLGLNALGSLNREEPPDSTYFTWLGQVQWLRRINLFKSQALWRLDLRLADEPLLPVEKFNIGGHATVRGYRESQLTTDNAIVTSLEWQVPFWQLKIPGLSKTLSDGIVQLAPFIDFGRGWNENMADPEPDWLCSAGLGLRWEVSSKISAEIYWGKILNEVAAPADYNPQDEGIHFRLAIQLY